jgi:four helix bundle protein
LAAQCAQIPRPAAGAGATLGGIAGGEIFAPTRPMINSDSRARTLALQKRCFEFSCAVIDAYPKGRIDDASRIIWRQLLRAATSSTFNLEEADAASSDADFVAKMRITLREAKEAHVAIRLIERCRLAGHTEVARNKDEANQLASIFHAIVKNKRENMKRAARRTNS